MLFDDVSIAEAANRGQGPEARTVDFDVQTSNPEIPKAPIERVSPATEDLEFNSKKFGPCVTHPTRISEPSPPSTPSSLLSLTMPAIVKTTKITRIVKKPTPDKVTPFQKRVCDLCSQVPRGKVTTYGRIAKALNSSPRAGTSPYAMSYIDGSWKCVTEESFCTGCPVSSCHCQYHVHWWISRGLGSQGRNCSNEIGVIEK
jgi:hypothetical protein